MKTKVFELVGSGQRQKSGLRVDSVYLKWEPDAIEEPGEGPKQTVQAIAIVSYPLNPQGDRRLQQFISGGLGGIDLEISADYQDELEQEQIEDLHRHLEHFGLSFIGKTFVTRS